MEVRSDWLIDGVSQTRVLLLNLVLTPLSGSQSEPLRRVRGLCPAHNELINKESCRRTTASSLSMVQTRSSTDASVSTLHILDQEDQDCLRINVFSRFARNEM